MKRGSVVLVVFKGDKVRPAVIVQNDLFDGILTARTVCLVTTDRTDSSLRVDVEPDDANGLDHPSQVQVDKIMTAPPDRIRKVVGHLTRAQMVEIDRRLRIHLDI